jgi:hypothetical protein
MFLTAHFFKLVKAEAERHSELVADPQRENPPVGNERQENRGRRTHPLGGLSYLHRVSTVKWFFFRMHFDLVDLVSLTLERD